MMFRVFFVFLFFCISCKEEKKKSKNTLYSETLEAPKNNYNFLAPKIFVLNTALSEISGLDYQDGLIYTHNDEEAKIFTVNVKTGKVKEKYNLDKLGDFEGICSLNNQIVLIKSNGDLFFYDTKKKRNTIVKSILNAKNNVEGLCYLKPKNQLLIACKGQMLDNDNDGYKKAIFALDLASKELHTRPFLTVNDTELKKQVNKQFSKMNLSKKEMNKLESRAVNFSPSGIAIHPKTKEYYIISAKGNLLLVLDTNKALRSITFLNKKQLPQAEGICFDEKANLYISTEIKNGPGILCKFQNIH